MDLARIAATTKDELRASPRGAPNPRSVGIAVRTLESVLERHLAAKQALESKAALVVPAVGTVGALFAGHPVASPLPGPMVALGLTVVAAALAAIGYSLRCLAAVSIAVGPNPVLLARVTTVGPDAMNQSVADALAIAIVSAKAVVIEQGAYFNRSLISAGTAVGALILFAMLGGFK